MFIHEDTVNFVRQAPEIGGSVDQVSRMMHIGMASCNPVDVLSLHRRSSGLQWPMEQPFCIIRTTDNRRGILHHYRGYLLWVKSLTKFLTSRINELNVISPALEIS